MEIVKNIIGNEKEYSYVVGYFSNTEVKVKKYQDLIKNYLQHKANKKKLGEVMAIHLIEEALPPTLYLVCLGEKEKYSLEKLDIVLRNIATKTSEKIILDVPSLCGGFPCEEVIKKVVLTLDFYSYSYDECKSKKDSITKSVYLPISKEKDELIEEYYNLASAINNVRDLINKPYNYLSAQGLADYALALCGTLPQTEIKVLGKAEIEALKMGAYLGVNKGSHDEAKLIYMTYTGQPECGEYIGLVGKGIMFDTGGYSIKDNMINMKDDMSGAATVLGLIEAVAKNKLPINLKIIIAATDNRIDGKAYLPDDVLTAMNGKTIEIVSTDAEGRLTLADALTYIQKEGCKTVIDLATLTGAVVVALGDYTTGIFGNNKDLINEIIKQGNIEGEDVWELPINDYIRDKVRSSKVADLTNSTGRAMGASGAAAFLEEFVEETTKWVHLDIAGTAFHTAPAYAEFYGASGVMMKTLYQVLKKIN